MGPIETSNQVVIDLVYTYFSRVFFNAMDRRDAFLQDEACHILGSLITGQIVAFTTIEL